MQFKRNTWMDRITTFGWIRSPLAARAVEERRRREDGVPVVDQLRREAVLVLVRVPRRHGRDDILAARGGTFRRLLRAPRAGYRSHLRPGRASRAALSDIDSATSAGVLGGVGVAAGELLHERAEPRRVGRHPHRVGDVHHLDRLPAVALPLVLAGAAAAGRGAPVSIALGAALYLLHDQQVIDPAITSYKKGEL